MAYASPTTVNASAGLGEVLGYVNNVTNGWLSNMILLGVYFIILIGFYKAKEDFKGALAVAGYSTLVIGIFFWVGGFFSPFGLGIAIGLAIIGTAVLLLDNN